MALHVIYRKNISIYALLLLSLHGTMHHAVYVFEFVFIHACMWVASTAAAAALLVSLHDCAEGLLTDKAKRNI